MGFEPCLSLTDGGAPTLGEPLLDEYLRFVAARARPNTVLAQSFDLKVFFTVVGAAPVSVSTADVLRFIEAQRQPRNGNVFRLVDGEAGLAASTIKRRLATVSGLFDYLTARGLVARNPVPRSLSARPGRAPLRGSPLVRAPRRLPRVLGPDEVDRLVAALRTDRDRAMVWLMLLGGLRRCEVLGLRMNDLRPGERRVFVAEGKGGHQRLVPVGSVFFTALADYFDRERCPAPDVEHVFVVLKGPTRARPLSAAGVDEVLSGARSRAGLAHATCHELRHTCFTRLREAGMALEAIQAQAGHASIESTRIYLHLASDWLVDEYRKGDEYPRQPGREPVVTAVEPATAIVLTDLAAAYVAAARVDTRGRRQAVRAFRAQFGDLQRWRSEPVTDRMAASDAARAFASFAAVGAGLAVDAEYVVVSASKWGLHVADRDPGQAAQFRLQAASLGFAPLEVAKMWSKLAQICVITGQTPDTITAADYLAGRDAFAAAVVAKHGGTSPKTLRTPLFGLNAVMFHRGQASRPEPRKPWAARSVPEIGWEVIIGRAPVLAATMRRYLDQLRISLRASSVACIETTLRQFAGHAVTHSEITTVAGIDRPAVEAYKTWLAARSGYRTNTQLSKTTIGMRMGHLSAFFSRIIEWDYPDAPARPPVFSSDRPIKDKPLPRFLDDAATAKFMAAARGLPDPFGRMAIEILARTGMRKGELLGLTVDAVVQIGSAYWLRVPLGKLHNDRYIPLHPQLKTMIDDWLASRPDWQNSPLLFTDRGRPIPGTRVDHAVRQAAAEAGIGHVHPHQLRHTLATQAINRGMSLEAIAALLGHKTMTMTLVYARIADRTVADQYFTVTEKVEALYQQQKPAILPAADEPSPMRKLRAEHHARMLGNGYCSRPVDLDCHYETICESCTFFVTTIEFRPTLKAQRDDAAAKGQTGRQKIYDGLLQRLEDTWT